MPITTKLVNSAEWLNMPVVEDATEEVVNGEIRIKAPAKITHMLVVQALRDALSDQFDRRRFYVVDTNFGLIIRRDPLTSRVPDIAVFRKSSMVVIDGYVHSAPELIVEVLSPADRYDERGEKLLNYASLGIPEFGVFSPASRTVEAFQLVNGGFQTSPERTDGILHPQHFPEVAIDVALIWPQ
jgi:Uma2 family endonuclease